MKCNMLKLSDNKTEFFVFKSKRNANTFAEHSVQVGGTEVDISLKVRNIGVASFRKKNAR